MVNPFQLLANSAFSKRRAPSPLRRVPVTVPNQPPTIDAVFLVLRRMRAPLVTVVVIFAVSVFGLALIPGLDSDGNPYRMTVFDAFYLMSYTATTIGFGEIPYALTIGQRMWVTVCIYLSVVGWAYAIGALFALLQDHGFREALAMQGFARRVRSFREPFLILAGYGQMGMAVAEALDALGRSCVVIDSQPEALEALALSQFNADFPGLTGDARDPRVLGLAGLGHKYCEGVLALTDSDNVNLSVVMAVTLLRPEVPVIARSNDRSTVTAMQEFGASAVINPYDRYGTYLVLRLRQPATFRFVMWLLATPGDPPPPLVQGLADGRWVVAADGRFGREIARDLESAGLDVTVADAKLGFPDVAGAVGFVAGSKDDSHNLAMAGHARLTQPGIFLSVRQGSRRNEKLLEAFAPESVFIPAQLTTQEALARVVTPAFWQFIEYVTTRDDAWSQRIMDRLIARAGDGAPDSARITLDAAHAPAAVRWMRQGTFTIRDLVRDPEDRDRPIACLPVMVVRGEGLGCLPPDDFELQPGDRVLVLGRPDAIEEVKDNLFHDHVVEYLATGRVVPSTWVWRAIRGARSTASAAPPED